MTTHPCFCGNSSDFKQCCLPIISGKQQALTAEQLMRSRYSAFCFGNAEYLISSLHPSKRHSTVKSELNKTLQQCKWHHLQIVETIDGQENDQSGIVEFIAIYSENDAPFQLHEKSHFNKEQNQWFYLNGEYPDDSPPFNIPSRNEGCWCNSGIKYKKCHGR